MVFSSLLFLFRFLPAVLLLYYIVPDRFKNLVLLVVSLVFYAWGEPVYGKHRCIHRGIGHHLFYHCDMYFLFHFLK